MTGYWMCKGRCIYPGMTAPYRDDNAWDEPYFKCNNSKCGHEQTGNGEFTEAESDDTGRCPDCNRKGKKISDHACPLCRCFSQEYVTPLTLSTH